MDKAPPEATPRELAGGLRLLLELGPLLVFFVANWLGGIYVATAAFMAATAAAIAASWMTTRKVAPMLLVGAALVTVFGALTLILHDETFIKLKPTVVYLFFAVVLYAGMRSGRLFLHALMGAAFPPMAQYGWRLLTRNWILFFLAMAALNEIVWRTFPTDVWVSFKVFGAIPLTLIFTFSQLPLISRHALDADEDDQARG